MIKEKKIIIKMAKSSTVGIDGMLVSQHISVSKYGKAPV